MNIVPVITAIINSYVANEDENDEIDLHKKHLTQLKNKENQRINNRNLRIQQNITEELDSQKTAIDIIKDEWNNAIKNNYKVIFHNIEIDSSNIDSISYNITYDHNNKFIYLSERNN